MYEIGSLIMYGEAGVCRIVDISEKEIGGEKKLYYTIQPCNQSYMIYSPINNERVFMRPIISKEEAENLIDLIPTIEAEAYKSASIREQIEHYESIVKRHDCRELIELTMSIYTKKLSAMENNKKVGAVDSKFMKKAEDLLFGELAAALEINQEDVLDYISNRIEQSK